ncbi:MAG: HAMP domain-containing protein, partial [Planctomycetota bacterium]
MLRKLNLALLSFLLLGGIAYAADHGADDAPLLTPEQAIQELHRGNARYVKGKMKHPRLDAQRREETAKEGQHPFATIIACSDSRVPVESIFDQGIGDIFVVRVAGNVCDVDEVGSIEYGIDHLGTPVLVVLGHTQCGAVTAVATNAEVHGNIPELVDNIIPAVEKAAETHPDVHGKELVPYAVEENVRQSIAELFRRSEAARNLVEAGKLKVVGAVYDLESGEVQWLGEHPEQAAVIAAAKQGPSHEAQEPHAVKETTTATAASHAKDRDENETLPEFHAEEVTVTLIDQGRLAQLDQNRNRTFQVPRREIQVAASAGGTSLLIGLVVLVLAGGVVVWRTGLLNRMHIGSKIYAGFAIAVVLAIVVGVAGMYYLRSVGKIAENEALAEKINRTTTELAKLQSDYLRTALADPQKAAKIREQHEATAKTVRELHNSIDRNVLVPEIETALGEFDQRFEEYVAAAAELCDRYARAAAELQEAGGIRKAMMAELDEMLTEQEKHLHELEESNASRLETEFATASEANLSEAIIAVEELSVEAVSFKADIDSSRVATMEECIARVKHEIEVLRQMELYAEQHNWQTPLDSETLKKLSQQIDVYQANQTEAVGALLTAGGEIVDSAEALATLDATVDAVATAVAAQAESLRSQANMFVLTVLCAVVVIGAVSAVVITRSITRPLQRAIDMLRDIAEGEGDLTKRLDDSSNDELGEMAKWFNRFVDKLEAIIAELREGALQFAEGARVVAESSQSLAGGAQEQSAAVEQISASMQQLTHSVEEVRNNAQEATNLASKASRVAEKGGDAVRRSSEAMELIRQSSQQISEIIQVISEIAGQTNLLALNAAIEAARAGEHGMG